MCGHALGSALCTHHLLESSPHSTPYSEKTETQRFNDFPQATGPSCTLSVATTAGRSCPRPVLGYSIQRLIWLWPWCPSVPADPDIADPARAQSLRLGRRGERVYEHRQPKGTLPGPFTVPGDVTFSCGWPSSMSHRQPKK